MTMAYSGLHCGDVLPGFGQAQPIWGDGPARWHCLQVPPQREDMAEDWLARRGVYAFHPVLRRQVRCMGRMRVYQRRYLPGYVFARFPGVAAPHRVALCPFIQGAIHAGDGRWAVLDPSGLSSIHAMRKRDEASRAESLARDQQRLRRLRPRAGEPAMFRAGALSGLTCEVVELQGDGGVRVRLRLFGHDALVSAEQQDLIAINKAG